MKANYLTAIPIFLFLFVFATDVSAQSRVKEKDIIGNWKLIIDLDQELEEAKLELEEEEEDSYFGRIILKSVSGLVTGIMDEIEIYMEFLPNGQLRVDVEAFGEHEVEDSSWYIENGKLYIEDTENYSSDDGDYWMMKDGVLVSYEESDENFQESVYMVKLE